MSIASTSSCRSQLTRCTFARHPFGFLTAFGQWYEWMSVLITWHQHVTHTGHQLFTCHHGSGQVSRPSRFPREVASATSRLPGCLCKATLIVLQGPKDDASWLPAFCRLCTASLEWIRRFQESNYQLGNPEPEQTVRVHTATPTEEHCTTASGSMTEAWRDLPPEVIERDPYPHWTQWHILETMSLKIKKIPRLSRPGSEALFFSVVLNIFVQIGTSRNELRQQSTGFDIASAWHEGVSVLPIRSAGCHPWRPSAFSQTGAAPCQGKNTAQSQRFDQQQAVPLHPLQKHIHWSCCITFCHRSPHVLYPPALSLINTCQCTLNTKEVSYPRAKSNYRFQIPLCKSSPVCVHRL